MRRKIEREIDMFATHPVVEKIGKMNWTGNVIPTNWFRNITFANGKPHFVAITILAEIVYWYRPSIVRDDNTGQIVEKKKFKDDMLQRSYQSFADQFGFSKRQAKEAIDYLVQRQLIRREFRNVRSFTGTILNNVMFVEPIPENLKNVTYEEKEMDVTFSCVKKEEATFPHPLPFKRRRPIQQKAKTNGNKGRRLLHLNGRQIQRLKKTISKIINYIMMMALKIQKIRLRFSKKMVLGLLELI